tara:strand:+ start:235 stop:849 length:615 start_codon:yes stop_codon:yes gene_type:complete
MQIKLKGNIKEFSKKVSLMQRDLVPSAASRAINRTLEKLKLAQTLQQRKYLDRPKPTTQKGYFIKYSSKRTLVGSLNMKDFVEEYLQYQIRGGFRYSDKKNPVPIQGSAALDQFGNIRGKRRGLVKNKNQFIGTIKGVTAVWERVAVRRGHSGGVKPIILLTQNFANYKEKFPFFKEGEKFVNKHFKKQMRAAFARAKRKAKVA